MDINEKNAIGRLYELVNSIKEMDLPEDRKYINRENLMWLQRNLGIKNSEHDHFNRAMVLIKEFLGD